MFETVKDSKEEELMRWHITIRSVFNNINSCGHKLPRFSVIHFKRQHILVWLRPWLLISVKTVGCKNIPYVCLQGQKHDFHEKGTTI